MFIIKHNKPQHNYGGNLIQYSVSSFLQTKKKNTNFYSKVMLFPALVLQDMAIFFQVPLLFHFMDVQV